MKFKHVLIKGLLPSVLVALSSSAHSCTGWGMISVSWGSAYFSSTDGVTISGYTQDTAPGNNNCVKLKQGPYQQIEGTRTCTTGTRSFSNKWLPSGFVGDIYLYEENSNRTAGPYQGGGVC